MSHSTVAPIRLAYVDLPDGQIHYAEAGVGRSVLLLHQTPRSWDEYRDVLPILGTGVRAIAMDTPGFGSSAPLVGSASIERWAGRAADFLDALGVGPSVLVGHHTGGVIALELAASRPDLVAALVLSSTPYTDAAFRVERAASGAPVDETEATPGLPRLEALWRSRESFYPNGRADLLERFVLDALRAEPRAHEGHAAVASYRMEDRAPLVRVPTLVIAAPDDPFAFPHAESLAGSLGAEVIEVPGGTVPLPDQLPEAFASVLLDFIGGLT